MWRVAHAPMCLSDVTISVTDGATDASAGRMHGLDETIGVADETIGVVDETIGVADETMDVSADAIQA
jgi:hypothetical protein